MIGTSIRLIRQAFDQDCWTAEYDLFLKELECA